MCSLELPQGAGPQMAARAEVDQDAVVSFQVDKDILIFDITMDNIFFFQRLCCSQNLKIEIFKSLMVYGI